MPYRKVKYEVCTYQHSLLMVYYWITRSLKHVYKKEVANNYLRISDFSFTLFSRGRKSMDLSTRWIWLWLPLCHCLPVWLFCIAYLCHEGKNFYFIKWGVLRQWTWIIKHSDHSIDIFWIKYGQVNFFSHVNLIEKFQ